MFGKQSKNNSSEVKMSKKVRTIFMIALFMLSFSILCGQVTNFPFFEDFESNTLPTGWTNQNNRWLFSNGYARITSYVNQYLITPQLALPSQGANQVMTLVYKITSRQISTVNYEIRLSTSGTDTENFTVILRTETLSTVGEGLGRWQTRSIDLSAYQGQNIYIAFNRTGGDNLWLDDVFIGEIIGMSAFPFSENFNANTLPDGWSNNGWSFASERVSSGLSSLNLITPLLSIPTTETIMTYKISQGNIFAQIYQVQLSTNGLNPENFTITLREEPGIGNTHWQTRSIDLSAYQDQDVYIAFKKLSGGDYFYLDDVFIGEPTYVSTFPFSENFNANTLPSGWTSNGWNFSSGIADGRYYTNLITPQLDIPQGANADMLLTYRVSSNGSLSVLNQILVSHSGINPEDFTVTLHEETLSSSDWQTRSIPLDSFHEQKIHIAFRRASGSGFLRIDDVWVGFVSLNPPQNLTATAENQLVSLAWDLPADGSTGTLMGYKIYRGNTANNVNTQIGGTRPLTPRTYQDSGLINGTIYHYQIVAVYSNPIGESQQSPEPPIQAIPFVWNPPRNLTATAGNGQVTLNWLAPDSGGFDIVGYKIYRGTSEASLSQIHTIVSNLLPTMEWVNNTDIIHGNSYFYAITASYLEPTPGGDSIFSNIAYSGPVSENDEITLHYLTSLYGSYPNPFNPETTISFAMAREGYVSIDIFNAKGQKVRSLVNTSYGVGYHSIVWNGNDDNGRNVGSGLYFYRMQTDGYIDVKRMLLMK